MSKYEHVLKHGHCGRPIGNSMSFPLEVYPLSKGNFLQRVFKINPKDNAFVELNNTLAKSKSIKSVNPSAIEGLNEKYKIDFNRLFQDRLQASYKAYILYCFTDRKFSQEEADAIFHLKKLFSISDTKHNKIYEDAGTEVYKQCLSEVLAESNMSPFDEEIKYLNKIRDDLQIPDKAVREVTKSLIEEIIDKIIKKNWISPKEDGQLQEVTKKLAVDIMEDDLVKAKLDRCRLFYNIAYGKVPTVHTDINLQNDEVCYFKTNADWYEPRRVINRVQYGGPSLKIKIAKGFYWNFRDYQVNLMTKDIVQKVDTGKLYLTDKRLIFSGNMDNRNIRISNIIDVVPSNDCVQIVKDSGKSPIIAFSNNLDVFVALLARAIQDQY